jgi:hypothetical protein
MGNYSNKANIDVFTFNANNPLKVEDIEQIFEIDGDYGANEGYFREDTISLGYRSEAHRCAEEVLNSDEIKDIEVETDLIETIAETVIDYYNGEVEFYLGNKDHCRDYEVDVSRVHDLIILAISHIS